MTLRFFVSVSLVATLALPGLAQQAPKPGPDTHGTLAGPVIAWKEPPPAKPQSNKIDTGMNWEVPKSADIAAEVLADGLILYEWAQTRYYIKHQKDPQFTTPDPHYCQNPFLGQTPKKGAADAYFAGLLLIKTSLVIWAKPQTRLLTNGAVILVEGAVINGNAKVGIKARF